MPFAPIILESFAHKIIKVPFVINTSFNLHNEPIVRTPSEAIKSYKISKIDALVLSDYILEK